MFRKPPLKTYQRKKIGCASMSINPSSIVRETISDNKDLQPKEFLAFKDSDKSLEYDPFDTTFDRIARDVIIPAIPQNLDDDSYSSSSDDSKTHRSEDIDEPLPDPLPIINPKPVSQRRYFKKSKLDEDVSPVKIESQSKAKRRKYRIDKRVDENTEPNIEKKSGKRARNIKDGKEISNVVPEKKRRMIKKQVVSAHKGSGDKNLDESSNLKECSVNLTRVDSLLSKFIADSNATNDFSNGEQIVVSSSSNKEKNREGFVEDRRISLREEKNTRISRDSTPKLLTESQEINLEKENKSTFKNPTVSLTRLNIPQARVSVANKYWLNSTPMTTKSLRPKSLLHISPIRTDKSMEKNDANESDNYDNRNLSREQRKKIQLTNLPGKKSQRVSMDRTKNAPISVDLSMETSERNRDDDKEDENLPSVKSYVESKNVTPKKSINSRFSKRSNKRNDKNSRIIKPLLSDSPDPEASGLMFDDTEIIARSAASHVSTEESGKKKDAEASTMSPFMGFSKGPLEVSIADSLIAVRSPLAPIGNFINTFEASTSSPFKGFSKDSTDSGSLHLTYDESDDIEKSGSRGKATFDSFASIPEVRLSRLEKSTKNVQDASKESAKVLGKRSEINPKDRQNVSEIGTEVTENSLEDTTEMLESSAKDSTEIMEDGLERSKENRQTSLAKSTEAMEDSSGESARDRQGSLNENAEDRRDSLIEKAKNRLKSNAKSRQSTTRKSFKNRQPSLLDDSVDLKTRLRKNLKIRQSMSTRGLKNRQSTLDESQENNQSILGESQENNQSILGESQENNQSTLDESQENNQSILGESQENNQSILDESQENNQSTLDESQENTQSMLNESQENTQSILNESQENTQSTLNESQENTRSTLNESQENTQSMLNESQENTQSILNESPENHQSTLKESQKNRQSTLKESQKNRQSTLNESQENQSSMLDSSVYDTKNISKEIAKDWESSVDGCSQNATEQTNSDGEWETTTESSKSNLSSVKSSVKIGLENTDNKSIMQVSSDEGNTSCDDYVEIVNASENFDQTDYGSDREKLSSFEVDESSKIETSNFSKVKIDESSLAEITSDEKSLVNNPRNSLQPIVLLSRCSIPLDTSKKIAHYKNTRSKKAINNSSLKNDDDESEKSMNQSQDLESIEQKNEKNESQKSQRNMTSLKLDESSETETKIDEASITEASDRDLSDSSFHLSIKKLENTSENSSKKIKVDKRNEKESFVVAKSSTKKSLILENSTKISTKNTHEDIRALLQPVVLLNRLHDPVRVGDRRKKYRNWNLSAITEDFTGKNVTTIAEETENVETPETQQNETNTEKINNEREIKMGDSGTKVISQESTISCDASDRSNQSNASIIEDKIVFLKPGKSWSRSLSLFRQVHSQDDLESLAIGKGKKWRQSVQNVLDMQQKGVIQSCVKKNADDKESRSCYGIRNSASAWIPGSSQPNTSGILSQTSVGSPGRFIRRISIRVVPDRKNSELYEDSPFLEAYGITSCENRKTIAKRSTSIALKKTLVYNVNCADVSFESIPRTLKSVTSRDVVLAQCGQDASVPFEMFYPDSYLKHCRKIGEGVFGEVFLYEDDSVRNVIKIIPIEGERKVNGERQKKFDEILSEIIIAKELNNLRFADSCKTSSFVEVKNIRCVEGYYPAMLIDLWNDFDNEKNSENDCPDMFDKDQLYIVLELGHGGQDLEAFVFQNSSEAHALFIQTALALAVAEEALEFEHRDLHWGNLLISRTEDSQIHYKLHNKDIKVASKGVKVSVIDFTLSRMSYQGCSIFNDLSLDDDLFAAQGEYQFEIYRLMRHKVENNWQTFEPFTNILWLHYTLDKMITAVRYRRTSTKIHKSGIEKLKVLKNEILGYKSACDFVTNCDNVTRLQASRSTVSTLSSTD